MWFTINLDLAEIAWVEKRDLNNPVGACPTRQEQQH
jgi:hypothetical protein